MKRETKDGIALTLLAVAFVVVCYVVSLWSERHRAAIWAEEMRKAGVPAGAPR
jgi:hypothetical protein